MSDPLCIVTFTHFFQSALCADQETPTREPIVQGEAYYEACDIVLNQLKYYYLGLKMPRITYSHEIIGLRTE